MPDLATVTLPAGLTGIPKDAFAGSTKLTTVNFKTADASTPSAKDGSDNAITLPKGITSIGQNAFQGTAASTVDLSQVTGLTTIDQNVFQGMTSLTTVKLPSGLTTINQSAFQGDAKLTMLTQAEASGVQARADEEVTAKFGSKLTIIRDNAFQGTGFSIVDLSAATTASSGTTPSLTVGSNAFTNMPELATVKLPANANINPANFGNPATAEGKPKLQTIKYGEDTTGSATATLSDANISSSNFSKIQNETIEIKSSTSDTINFTGGVFNGNGTMKKLKLSIATGTRNGNASL